MASRRLMFVVLAVLLVFGLALSLVAAWRSGDWWGFAPLDDLSSPEIVVS